MFPMGNSRMPLKTPLVRCTSDNTLPPKHLCAPFATRSLWLLRPLEQKEFPRANSHYLMAHVPDYPVRKGKHHWRIRVRPGPCARGDGVNTMGLPPPGLRKVGVSSSPDRWDFLRP